MNPDKIRKVYAPYSTTGEQVGQTPLEGYVDVAQAIYPAVNTGQIGKNGEWSGVTVSDKTFTIDTEHPAIPNGEAVLSPQTANRDFIDMTGFTEMFIALKVTRQGNYAIEAVFGPDTKSFANLTPINSGVGPRGNEDFSSTIEELMRDTSETLTANVWDIFKIDRMRDQKVLQFKITNNSGGNSDIQFAFMRLV